MWLGLLWRLELSTSPWWPLETGAERLCLLSRLRDSKQTHACGLWPR